MSDLYVELRSRIPVVASRTEIGRARLEAAQSAVGLSNERLARLIPVSEKTWRRWKDAGAIPTASLPAVARVLRLELVEAQQPTLVGLDGDGGDPHDRGSGLELVRVGIEQLLEGQQEMLLRLARLEEKLDEPESRRPARRAK